MCLGIPVQVIESGEHFARCLGQGGQEVRVDLALVGPQAPSTWLMTFLDAAREVISADHARMVNDALAALQAAERGETNFDAFFADLDREPQLPEFLRKAHP